MFNNNNNNNNNNNFYLKSLHISTTNISSVELLLRFFKNLCTLYTLSCGNATCSRPQQTTPRTGIEPGTPGPMSDALPTAPARSTYFHVSYQRIINSAFITIKDPLQFCVLPFGLCKAPTTLQCLMAIVLAGLQRDICLRDIHDMIVSRRTFGGPLNNPYCFENNLWFNTSDK